MVFLFLARHKLQKYIFPNLFLDFEGDRFLFDFDFDRDRLFDLFRLFDSSVLPVSTLYFLIPSSFRISGFLQNIYIFKFIQICDLIFFIYFKTLLPFTSATLSSSFFAIWFILFLLFSRFKISRFLASIIAIGMPIGLWWKIKVKKMYDAVF